MTLPSLPPGTPEWDVLQAIIRGDRWFERDETPEPSLLPHLARLCHDFSLGEMWNAAEVVGLHSGPFHWPQLLESTADRLSVRFDDDVFSDQLPNVALIEPAVRRCVAGARPPGDDLWASIDALDDGELQQALTARLLLVDPDPARLERLLAEVDIRFARSETTRAIMSVAASLGRRLDTEWVDTAVGGQAMGVGHAAHVLPALTEASARTRLADQIVAVVNREGGPDWWIALVTSRLAPHLSGGVSVDLSQLFDRTGIWRPLIESIATAPPAPDLDADVLRAHPLRDELDRIVDPHEVTEGVGNAIVDRHGGAPPMSAAPPPPMSAPPPPPMPAAPAPSPPPAPVTAPPVPAAPPPAPAAPPATRGNRWWRRRRSVDRSATPPPQPGPDDRRLGIDLLVGGLQAPIPIPAAVAIELRVSIGHRAAHRLASPADVPFEPGVESRSLPVRFVNADIDQTAPMTLFADPSTEGAVTFLLPPTGRHLTGTIIVYNEDRSTVIQAASLFVPVLGAPSDVPPVVQFVAVDAAVLSAPARPGTATIVTDGSTTAAAAPSVDIPASASAVMNQFEAVVSGIETAAGQFAHAGAPIDATLRAVARVGAQLRTQLGLEPLSGFDRIQMVAVDTQTVFPIDLIYDGDEPDTDAELCPDWQQALAVGRCDRCAALDPVAARAVVCPIRFWGLSKIIEHHRPTGATTQFVAHVHPVDGETHLQPVSTVLVGASDIVLEQRRRELGPDATNVSVALADLVEAATPLAAVTVAGDWDAWRAAIADTPALLLAMPHNTEVTEAFVVRAALELGGALIASISEDYVRHAGTSPGPVVMLLGCNTGTDRHSLLSFASTFRLYSPIVVATVGEVIAKESPLIARAILDQLVAASDDESRTVGEALRSARCTLMAQSRLVALQLLLHGDGDWILTRS